jgi:uncharacterized protein (DUF2147 family)
LRRFAIFENDYKAQVLSMLQRPRNTISKLIYSGLFLSVTGVAPALAGDPTGDWRVADGVANIRVAECNGAMWGAVSWEKEPGGRDKNNPDPAKQSRPTLGMATLIDMKKTPGADQWEGQVYNAKDGQLYKASIKLASPDQLEIQGCVLGFLCGGETWTRVGPPIPSSPTNAMAAGSAKGPKTTGAAGNRTVAANSMAPKAKAGQKKPDDPVGDICLLPDIARLPH